jgi:beta-alanine degradation protein BauB
MEANENLGTRMMLENDRVRVWEHRVPSGGTGPMHLHRRPYLSVVVQGSTGDTLGPDGDVLEHFELAPGTALWFADEDLPETHALRNTGDDEILIVTTELL